MIIKVSYFTKNHETEETNLVFSKTVECQELKELDDAIGLYDCFESKTYLCLGLNFYDIYFYSDDIEDYVEKLKHFDGLSCENEHRMGIWICAEPFYSGETEFKEYPQRGFVLYSEERYECGASGFNCIVYWASEHPFCMVFIGGIIWDFAKAFLAKIKGLFRKECKCDRKRKYYKFAFEKFYKKFSVASKLETREFGVIAFSRVRYREYRLTIRTKDEKFFSVKAYANGDIISFKKV